MASHAQSFSGLTPLIIRPINWSGLLARFFGPLAHVAFNPLPLQYLRFVMNNLLNRSIVCLFVFCLIADPTATAAALPLSGPPVARATLHRSTGFFQAEAFSP